MSTPLGSRLKARRTERGLTLEALASVSGISKAYLWQLENAETCNPSVNKMRTLAKVLDVPLSFFFEEAAKGEMDDILDEAFFYRYRKQTPKVKEMLREFLNILEK